MSSTLVTVAELIAKLQQYPQDMYVVIDSNCDPLEAYEGFFDGPAEFQVIPVCDVRTGMNPVGMGWEESWKALLIR